VRCVRATREAEFASWQRQHINSDAKKRVNEPHARYAR
jgi:death-on-curing protein